MLRTCSLVPGAQLFGKGLCQQRLIVPLFNKVQGKWKIVFANYGAAIESNTGTRVLRREADSDNMLESLRSDRVHRIGNEWFPISHAGEDRQLHRSRWFVCPQESPACERGGTNQRAAMP